MGELVDDMGFDDSSSQSDENKEIVDALKEPEPDIEVIPVESEMDKKLRIIRRLRTLRKINPSLNIPSEDFTIEDDLDLMERTLNDVVLDIKLDQNLTIYRTVLQGYFGGVEFVAGMLDYDMVGFAGSQMKMMRRYDSLLMEIAEKNSGGWASSLSPEIRLLGLIIIQTAIYFIFRYIYNKKGAPQAYAFQAIVDAVPAMDSSSTTPQEPTSNKGNSGTSAAPEVTATPRAKGPSVNIKEIEAELGSTSSDVEDVEDQEEFEDPEEESEDE